MEMFTAITYHFYPKCCRHIFEKMQFKNTKNAYAFTALLHKFQIDSISRIKNATYIFFFKCSSTISKGI